MEIVDLLESLHLHNTTYAGLQQKPGPHSHHPAALFSGTHQVLRTSNLVLSYSSTQVPVYSSAEAPKYISVPLSTMSSLLCALYSGVERSVYYSRDARDRVASLIQSSKEFAFVTSIRLKHLDHTSHIVTSDFCLSSSYHLHHLVFLSIPLTPVYLLYFCSSYVISL